MLQAVWSLVEGPLLAAARDKTVRPEAIKGALQVDQYHRERLAASPLPELMIQAVRDREFPKVRRDRQITFIADSIAAWGVVSPRRSRQICRLERRKRTTE